MDFNLILNNISWVWVGLVFIFVLFFLIFFIVFLQRKKEQEFLNCGMSLALFLVTLPQRIKKEKAKEIPLEEYLKTAEQFHSSLAGIKEPSVLKRFLLGNPAFVFEIAVHRLGEEIYFYVACPRSIAGVMEKQILSFWPKAQVQPTSDYNIFNSTGFSAGAHVKLAKSAVLPLKSYKEFGTDPLSVITSVFTKFDREGEGAAIQILIRPSQQKLKELSNKVVDLLKAEIDIKTAVKSAEAATGVIGFLRGFIDVFFGAFLTSKPKEKSFIEKKTVSQTGLSPIQQELISAISEKSSQPIFDVNLRILASASTESQADIILNQLQSAFEQFNSPALNQFKFKKLSKGKLRKFFYDFSFRIFEETQTMFLSSKELAGIFHFPSPTLFTPCIKWLKTRQVVPPVSLQEQGLIIGKNIFRGEQKIIRILDNDRRRHFYIIGQTGTGKSVLLQEMIKQDIENGKGVCLVDPHGDLSEAILSLIPASRAEDVVYFNPSDTQRPLGLNMLEYDSKFPEAKTFVVNELLEIFDKLYNLKTQGMGGPVFEQYMRNSLLLIMEDPASGNTLIEVPKVLADVNFRKYKLSRCKNIVVKNFWEQEAEKTGGEHALANMVPYITSKMNIFIANDMVRPIISQQQSSFNMREIMDQGKILIVNLAKGKLGDINSHLLGMIVIGKILIASFSRADVPEEKRRDFYLYIDEFHNVITQTITAVLAEARKYRLNMIFGHQFIGQLNEETRKAIFGNVGSILAFRVGPEDAKYLLSGFEPTFDEEDLINLDNYNAAFRLLIKGETSRPFNIATFPPSKENPEIARLIKEHSRLKFGRDRATVETELHQRLQKSFIPIP